MERTEIHDQAKYQEFSRMMSELQLQMKYTQTLKENGFDEWASVSELDYQILEEIGVSDNLDRKQILACVRAAEDVQSLQRPIEPEMVESAEMIKVDIMEDNNQTSEENTMERYEREEEFGAYLTKEPLTVEKAEEDDEVEQTLGIALKQRFGHTKSTDLSKKQIEKASFTSCGRYQNFRTFCKNVTSLYLANKGFTNIVNIRLNIRPIWRGLKT